MSDNSDASSSMNLAIQKDANDKIRIVGPNAIHVEKRNSAVIESNFITLIMSCIPGLEKVITSEKNSIKPSHYVDRSDKHEREYYITYIVSHIDRVLIELANKYGMPRGFAIIWYLDNMGIPQLANYAAFTPKFANEDHDGVLNKVKSFSLKYSGSLGMICAFDNCLFVGAKNSTGNIFAQALERCIRADGVITLEFVQALAKLRWTIGFEIMVNELGDDHAAPVELDAAVATVITCPRSDPENFGTDKLGMSFYVPKSITAVMLDAYNVKHAISYEVVDDAKWEKTAMPMLKEQRHYLTRGPLYTLLNDLVTLGIIRQVSGTYAHPHSSVVEGIIFWSNLPGNDTQTHIFKWKIPRYTIMTFVIRGLIQNGHLGSGVCEQYQCDREIKRYLRNWIKDESKFAFFSRVLWTIMKEIEAQKTPVIPGQYLRVCHPIAQSVWERAVNGKLDDIILEKRELTCFFILTPMKAVGKVFCGSLVELEKANMEMIDVMVNSRNILPDVQRLGFKFSWDMWPDESTLNEQDLKRATGMKKTLMAAVDNLAKQPVIQAPVIVKQPITIYLMQGMVGTGKSTWLSELQAYIIKHQAQLTKTIVFANGDNVKGPYQGKTAMNMIILARDKPPQNVSWNIKTLIERVKTEIVLIIDKNTPNIDDVMGNWERSPVLRQFNVNVMVLRNKLLDQMASGQVTESNVKEFCSRVMTERAKKCEQQGTVHSVGVDAVETVVNLFYNEYMKHARPDGCCGYETVELKDDGNVTLRFMEIENIAGQMEHMYQCICAGKLDVVPVSSVPVSSVPVVPVVPVVPDASGSSSSSSVPVIPKGPILAQLKSLDSDHHVTLRYIHKTDEGTVKEIQDLQERYGDVQAVAMTHKYVDDAGFEVLFNPDHRQPYPPAIDGKDVGVYFHMTVKVPKGKQNKDAGPQVTGIAIDELDRYRLDEPLIEKVQFDVKYMGMARGRK